MQRILVTGGAGFIGSHFVRYLLRHHPAVSVTVLDKLTYAGILENLAGIRDDPRFRLVVGDVADPDAVRNAIAGCSAVAHLAAESHVDRSLMDPGGCVHTQVHGTLTLLQASLEAHVERFLLVSTDEVYGPVLEGSASEESLLRPSSPYSATKAAAEHLAHAYAVTYDLPVLITRGSNNLGPYQYPEKMLPLFITNALEDRPLPIYGDGHQRRDWLHVEDHCAALDLVLREGEPGTIYNVGSGEERENLAMARAILARLGKPETLITFVQDRPGHDRRYSVATERIRTLGWQPRYSLDQALEETIRWYQENQAWWKRIKAGEYQEYYRRMYLERSVLAPSG
ncbi:MAG: dTDP-glucose 4,6-dehydratase [Armatimonadetes bacterium]|nr:dTDP-glucose 4,6-dehydratase [Armatimonadota bacterium]